MNMTRNAIIASALLLATATGASAHARHHHGRHAAVLRHDSGGGAGVPRDPAPRSWGGGGLVTVQTAAGVPITVASDVASKFVGFIGDLVAEGYRPRHIGCFARGGHVRNSNHYWGGACDVDQTARNRTDGFMYHVASIAARWGLRDGCSFGDCGHVDVPRNVGGLARWNAALSSYARVGRHYRRRHYA